MARNKIKYFLISFGIILPVFSTGIHLRSGDANNQFAAEGEITEMK